MMNDMYTAYKNTVSVCNLYMLFQFCFQIPEHAWTQTPLEEFFLPSTRLRCSKRRYAKSQCHSTCVAWPQCIRVL